MIAHETVGGVWGRLVVPRVVTALVKDFVNNQAARLALANFRVEPF